MLRKSDSLTPSLSLSKLTFYGRIIKSFPQFGPQLFAGCCTAEESKQAHFTLSPPVPTDTRSLYMTEWQQPFHLLNFQQRSVNPGVR